MERRFLSPYDVYTPSKSLRKSSFPRILYRGIGDSKNSDSTACTYAPPEIPASVTSLAATGCSCCSHEWRSADNGSTRPRIRSLCAGVVSKEVLPGCLDAAPRRHSVKEMFNFSRRRSSCVDVGPGDQKLQYMTPPVSRVVRRCHGVDGRGDHRQWSKPPSEVCRNILTSLRQSTRSSRQGSIVQPGATASGSSTVQCLALCTTCILPSSQMTTNDGRGRSRSLTHIDTLEPTMSAGEDSEHLSEPEATTADLTSRHCHYQTTVRRRHFSMRNRLMSSDTFLVSFDLESRASDESSEHIPIMRANFLREAISSACKSRNIDMDSISVYLEGYRTPLPLLTTETYWLSGKHLRVKVRDAGNKSPVRSHSTSGSSSTPVRKASGSYRGMVNRLMSGSGEEAAPPHPAPASAAELCTATAAAATLSGSSDGSLKLAAVRAGSSASAKQHNRWSGLFGGTSGKDSVASKMDAMIFYLDTYSRHGIPRIPQLVSFDAAEEEELYILESDWREVVDSVDEMTPLCRQQQDAIWELIHTEAAYIHTLKVVTDLFLSCLCNLQSNGILTEVSTTQLFSNIEQIYSGSRFFWHQHIMRMLTESRSTRRPLDISNMCDGFGQFEEIFRPYTRYCLDQSSIKMYCKSLVRHNTIFNGYLAWCETQKDCNRLRLVDILAKPWQRITKYSLLLKAIFKKTNDISVQAQIRQMIQCVDVVVASVDGSLRSRHEQEKVRFICEKIDSFDCVETKDDEVEKLLKSHQSVDLSAPMPGCGPMQRRSLVLEADLKLRDHLCSKAEVRCFLFTDMLLICKPVARKTDRLRVLRPPLPLHRLFISESTRDSSALHIVCLNEYHTAVAALTLVASDSRQLKTWSESIRKSQELYRQMRQDAGGSQEYSSYYDDDGDELELPAQTVMLSCGCSPRGSNRSSRVPSLIHSHSSSIDNSEHHQVTRGSPGCQTTFTCDDLQMAVDLTGSEETLVCRQQRGAFSPRQERSGKLRSVGSTPNQLSVITHLSVAGRQSMPNLAASDLGRRPVPLAGTTSPTQRRSGHTLAALTGHRSAESSGCSRPLTRAQPVTTSPPPPAATDRQSEPPGLQADTDQRLGGSGGPSPYSDADQEALKSRRLCRGDRAESKRYLTAGVIDDMKREELRDNAIHKRLSWNYGHQATSACSTTSSQSTLASQAGRQAIKCTSTESVQSSSGVSSVNSLHLSTTSETETIASANFSPTRTLVEDESSNEPYNHTSLAPLDTSCGGVNSETCSHPNAHISTTYISTTGDCRSAISYIASSQTGVSIDIADTGVQSSCHDSFRLGQGSSASCSGGHYFPPTSTRVQITFGSGLQQDSSVRSGGTDNGKQDGRITGDSDSTVNPSSPNCQEDRASATDPPPDPAPGGSDYLEQHRADAVQQEEPRDTRSDTGAPV